MEVHSEKKDLIAEQAESKPIARNEEGNMHHSRPHPHLPTSSLRLYFPMPYLAIKPSTSYSVLLKSMFVVQS